MINNIEKRKPASAGFLQSGFVSVVYRHFHLEILLATVGFKHLAHCRVGGCPLVALLARRSAKFLHPGCRGELKDVDGAGEFPPQHAFMVRIYRPEKLLPINTSLSYTHEHILVRMAFDVRMEVFIQTDPVLFGQISFAGLNLG